MYGSGTSGVRSGEELAGCSAGAPDRGQGHRALQHRCDSGAAQGAGDREDRQPAAHLRRSVHRCHPGLWKGGSHGEDTQFTSVTNQCHDITTYPALGLAAGACSGNGILLDISDPVNPKRLDAVVDEHFAYWHSATFNNDGTKVIFTDEWGGGTIAALPRHRPADLGRQRHLQRRRQEAGVRRLLQDARAADGTGELRRAQRVARSRCRGATS